LKNLNKQKTAGNTRYKQASRKIAQKKFIKNHRFYSNRNIKLDLKNLNNEFIN